MGKFLKPSLGLSVGKLDWVCVELLRNCQPSFCRQKVSLEVKRLVVLVSARWLHGCLLGLLITADCENTPSLSVQIFQDKYIK